jgi:hypothetical protein
MKAAHTSGHRSLVSARSLRSARLKGGSGSRRPASLHARLAAPQERETMLELSPSSQRPTLPVALPTSIDSVLLLGGWALHQANEEPTPCGSPGLSACEADPRSDEAPTLRDPSAWGEPGTKRAPTQGDPDRHAASTALPPAPSAAVRVVQAPPCARRGVSGALAREEQRVLDILGWDERETLENLESIDDDITEELDELDELDDAASIRLPTETEPAPAPTVAARSSAPPAEAPAPPRHEARAWRQAAPWWAAAALLVLVASMWNHLAAPAGEAATPTTREVVAASDARASEAEAWVLDVVAPEDVVNALPAPAAP